MKNRAARIVIAIIFLAGFAFYTYRQEGAKGICYYLARCGKHGLEVLLHAKDHRLKRLWVLGSSMVRGIGFAPKVEYLNTAQEDKKSIEGEAFLC